VITPEVVERKAEPTLIFVEEMQQEAS